MWDVLALRIHKLSPDKKYSTFPFFSFLYFMLIISMVRIGWREEVELWVVHLIAFDSLLEAGTISGYKAGSLVNNILRARG